jgi:TRAP-type mannitol/chloroaromatic compound transport system substrate-binding protein
MANRRTFLKGTATGAAVAIAAPAVAQSTPSIRWRLTSSYPKALDVIYGASETIASEVAELTSGQFIIQPFAAGEIVPGLQAIDAVQNGTVEMCHTVSFYNIGKDPAWAFGTGLPFGMNARQQNAWLYHGEGKALLDAFYAKHGLVGFPAGNSGAQMGGWFRKEIKSLDDMRGMKMRISGLAGNILAKLGSVPQLIAAGDIYPSLERGTIDAAEWIGPHDDERLGFVRIAPYYYYPGWWEGGLVFHCFVNKAQWDGLPKTHKAAIRTACQAVNADVMAKYDAKNPAAIKRLVAAGARLRPFPRDVMEAAFKAAEEVYADAARRSSDFAGIYDAYRSALKDGYLWWQVAELSADSFNVAMQTR